MAIQVLDRAAKILQIVARQGPCSLTSIAAEASLPVPTAARIAASLVENGVLERLENRKYRLGLSLLPLISKLEPVRQSLSVVHNYTEQLSRHTAEDCGFAVVQGTQAVVADWCYGPRFPRIIEPFSRRIPLYCTFGKVLIAYQPKEWRERYIGSVKLKRITSGTITDRTVLQEETKRIRETGFYVSNSENVEGAGSVTVPVFAPNAQLLGALFVTAPLSRLTERRIEIYKEMLRDTTTRLRASRTLDRNHRTML